MELVLSSQFEHCVNSTLTAFAAPGAGTAGAGTTLAGSAVALAALIGFLL